MNKTELVAAVAERLDTSKTTAEAHVNAFLDTITTTVAKGERVGITGFGSFEKNDKPARDGHNPATGEKIRIPARSVPKFTPGADFRGLVAGPRAQS